jgi:hypothetical protein
MSLDKSGNALIENTYLGFDERGILTATLTLNFSRSGAQNFGYYSLANYPIKVIGELLKVVGVSSWEKLCGQYVRFNRNDNGQICSIENVLKDKLFSFDNVYQIYGSAIESLTNPEADDDDDDDDDYRAAEGAAGCASTGGDGE